MHAALSFHLSSYILAKERKALELVFISIRIDAMHATVTGDCNMSFFFQIMVNPMYACQGTSF